MAVFPFFRLPRELRDQIYAEVGGKDVTFHLDVKIPVQAFAAALFRVTIHSLPLQNLALVSRQFKQEYEDETQSHASILVQPAKSSVHTVFQLKKDNQIHRCIRSISTMTIRTRQHKLKDVFGAQQDAHDLILRALLPFMSSLKSVMNDCCHVFFREDPPRPTNDAFEDSILQYGDQKIAVRQGLIYTTPLFSLADPYLPSPAERDQYPAITRMFQWDDTVREILSMDYGVNYVTWRVNRPNKSSDIGDLNLELLEAGSFNEQAMLQHLESRCANRLEM